MSDKNEADDQIGVPTNAMYYWTSEGGQADIQACFDGN